MRVDEGDALEKPADVTNHLVDKFRISTEITGGDASCLNGKNERQKISIQNMVSAGIIGSNQHEKNCVVYQKHHLKYTYEKYIVH